MTKQQGDGADTTVATRWMQAAILTLLVQLVAQLYPGALVQTPLARLQDIDDVLVAWEAIQPANASSPSH